MSDIPERTSARAIRPARSGLDAAVRIPGSKSITNRALLLAALAGGSSTLRGALVADDTRAFAAGLRALGFAVDEATAGAWGVRGAAGRIPAAEADVFCAEAGTAARFLLAAGAAGEGRYRMDAAPQLRRRPLAQLLEALRAQGARTEPPDAKRLPLMLEARGLAGGSLRLPGDTSSQFISALLMAAPLGRAPLELAVSGLVSRPYVDMTLAMMAQFGVEAERRGHEHFRVAPAVYTGRDYAVEPDASTASYFFAAAAITGGRVKVLGLRRDGGLQGDVRFLDVLQAMGCSVSEEPDGVVVAGPATPTGLTVDMSDISDTFMTLVAVAPFASSPVTVTGIANVRLKESDRIAAMESNLHRLGIRTASGPDFLRVYPSTPRGGRVDPHGDHRIAMSFAVLGLRARGVAVEDPGCVRKTFPDFFEIWKALEQGTA
ncbi:MAG: 3-phosphoshikimate 1-carboxyvinyltransferase [Actinobacteria bacterium]|nr:3-phosphoshikimate 1-carboxyvinyltransferase [Actinomycetota bacterium]